MQCAAAQPHRSMVVGRATTALAAVPARRQAAACRPCGTASNQWRVYAAAGDGAAASTATAAAPLDLPVRLNTIPHERSVRQWFYLDVAAGVAKALDAGEMRVVARCTCPELNTEFDVYRAGTLLELVRAVATELLAADPARKVRVCVQQPLGEGVFAGTPMSLNGMTRIMGQMDWSPYKDRILLGNIGAGEVEGADAFILISPQNIVGHSIIPFLEEMTEAAGAAGKPMVLINPKLGDIQSAGGVGSIRGRQDRLDFTGSFTPAYHYRLLYKGANMYPIMGALRYSYGGDWEVFRRVELGKGEEEYRLIGSFSQEPKAPQITDAFRAAWAAAAKQA